MEYKNSWEFKNRIVVIVASWTWFDCDSMQLRVVYDKHNKNSMLIHIVG